MPIEINDLLNFTDQFNKDSKKIKSQVIDKAADKSVNLLVKELKKELNQFVSDNFTVDDKVPAQDLAQPKVRESTSRKEIIKQLTGMKTFQPKNDFSQVSDGVVFARKSNNSDIAARMELRIDHDLMDDLQTQYAAAHKFYSNAVYALPNSTGGFDYYQNNGFDPSSDLKVKCSKYRGISSDETFGGMSPQRRFDEDSKKGYSTWTLKQSFIDKIPNNPSFIHLNPIVEKIIENDFDSVNSMINGINDKSVQNRLQQQASNFEKNENLSPGASEAAKVNSLIASIQIVKKIQKKSVVYKIVANENRVKKNLLDEMKAIVSRWKVLNHQKVYIAIEKRINDFVKRISK